MHRNINICKLQHDIYKILLQLPRSLCRGIKEYIKYKYELTMKMVFSEKTEILISIFLSTFLSSIITISIISLTIGSSNRYSHYDAFTGVFAIINSIINGIMCLTSFFCIKSSVKENIFLFYLSNFGLLFAYNFFWIFNSYSFEYREGRYSEMLATAIPFIIFIIGQTILCIRWKGNKKVCETNKEKP